MHVQNIKHTSRHYDQQPLTAQFEITAKNRIIKCDTIGCCCHTSSVSSVKQDRSLMSRQIFVHDARSGGGWRQLRYVIQLSLLCTHRAASQQNNETRVPTLITIIKNHLSVVIKIKTNCHKFTPQTRPPTTRSLDTLADEFLRVAEQLASPVSPAMLRHGRLQ